MGEMRKDDDVELTLTLGLGFSTTEAPAATGIPAATHIAAPPLYDHQGGFGDMLRRREMQALQRQKTRRKREEKQQRKATAISHRGKSASWSGDGVAAWACSPYDRVALEAQQQHARERDRRVNNNDGRGQSSFDGEITSPKACSDDRLTSANPDASSNGLLPPYGGHFPVLPIPYPMAQYLPFPNAYGFPYIVPYWSPNVPPAICGNGVDPIAARNVFQPVAGRSFQTFNDNQDTNIKDEADVNNRKGDDIIRRTSSLSVSQGSSFSAVSGYRSCSLQGGTNSPNTKSHSDDTPVEKPQSKKLCRQGSNPLPFSEDQDYSVSSHQPEPQKKEDGQPVDNQLTCILPAEFGPSPDSNPVTDQAMPLRNPEPPELPTLGDDQAELQVPSRPPRFFVTARGGDDINSSNTFGLLLYNGGDASKLSIVCMCHKTLFSPAEFVKHACGKDVEHPLRHIIVSNYHL